MDPLNPKGNAKATVFTPTVPGDWSPVPTQVGDALDQLAAKPDPEDAVSVAYTPTTPGDWTVPPTEVGQALDELAAKPDVDVASAVGFTPAVPGNWTVPPTQVAQALDELAAKPDPDIASAVGYAPTTPGDWTVPPTQVAQALDELAAKPDPDIASAVGYTPTTPGDWAVPPIQVAQALDELAAKPDVDVASAVGYTPATPGDWPVVPTQVAQALDEVASKPYTPSTPGDWSPVPTHVGPALDQLAAKQEAPDLAAGVGYTPTTPGNWSPSPAEVKSALDQLAARPIGGGGGGDIFVYREEEPAPNNTTVFNTFDAAYHAARATGIPATVVIDDTIAQCSIGNAYGQGVNLTVISGSTATLTNLHGILPYAVGKHLWITNANNSNNLGLFVITAVLSPSSIQITNPLAVVETNSNIQWFLIDDITASIGGTPSPTLGTLLNGITTSMVGQSIRLFGCGNSDNNGTFPIVAYVSSTALWYDNPLAVPNDFGLWATLFGDNAAITFFDGFNTATISGLTGMTPQMVGGQIHIEGAASGPNNGDFSIIAFIDANTIQINTSAAVAPDGNNGSISWAVRPPNFGSIYVAQANLPQTTITGLTGMSGSIVGNSLTIQNSDASPTNNDILIISGYISPTSVLINFSGGGPEGNQGALYWYLGTDYDLHQIAIAGTRLPGGSTSNLVIYDGVTWNRGFSLLTNWVESFTEFTYQRYLGTLGNFGSVPTMRVFDNSYLYSDNNGLVFDISQGSSFYLLILDEQSRADGFINFGSNPNNGINVDLYENTTVSSRFAQGTAGNVSVTVHTVLEDNPVETQSNFSGSYNVSYEARASGLVPFISSGAPAQPGPYNIQTGTSYYDMSAVKPYWWTGGTWITWPDPGLPGVAVSGTPSVGQVLTATSPTTADWETPVNPLGVTLSGTPSTGQTITATSPTTATWQTPATTPVTPNLFIYRSGAVPGGNVYATFDDAFAAATTALASGIDVAIGIDDTGGACSPTPGNDYDLSRIPLVGGFGPNSNTLTVNNATFNEGFTLRHNLILDYTAGGFLMAFAGTATVRLEDNCQLNTTAINVWNFGPSTLNIHLGDRCGLNGDYLFYTPLAGAVTNIFYEGEGCFVTSSVAFNYAAPGVVANSYVNAGAVFLPIINGYSNFHGVANYFFEDQAANLAPYTGSGALPDPTSSPNVQTGSSYFDQTTGAPYWWNGSAWIVAYTPPPVPPAPSIFHGQTISQTTNLSGGDHITFNSALFQQGTNISLDAATPYTSALGQPSIGRITLAPGHTYKLTASVGDAQGAGTLTATWRDAASGGTFGTTTRIQNVGPDTDTPGQCVAFIAVSGTPALVEVYIPFNSGVTAIGNNPLNPWFAVEEVS